MIYCVYWEKRKIWDIYKYMNIFSRQGKPPVLRVGNRNFLCQDASDRSGTP